MTLRDEIRQGKPFESLGQEVFLTLARTEAVLRDGLERVLAPHGLSFTQYNVLRILRGAGPAGLCRNEIRDRLITRMPDVSRLLDRMEAAGLISRVRSTEDRRLVNTTLTERGRALVDELDGAVSDEHQRRLGHMTDHQLATLVELLTLARAGR
jgi:DNA-binding MarR family transcriptional regulator